jgi:membrane protease YdiL (CAAX protease family)
MKDKILQTKPLLKFYLLLLGLSIPFWILGAMTEELAKMLPINLPISALMFLCPLIATLILIPRENKKEGIRKLIKRIFDYKKIKNKNWYIVIFGLTPGVMFIVYVVMLLQGKPLPNPVIPVLDILIFFILFFFSAVCEEIGWMGYVIEHMKDNSKVLKTGIIMGLAWGIWHAVPYFQGNHDFQWVLWQILSSVFNRILIVWIYNNNEKSMFSAVIYHTMINVSVFSFPNYGSHYDPAITVAILGIVTVIVLAPLYKICK